MTIKQQQIKKNNFKIIMPLVLLLILITSIIIIYIFTGRASIKGIISDSTDSTILNGVSITLDNRKVILNNNFTGAFNFSGLKKGEHNITFSRTGYKPYSQTVNLERGDSLNLRILLNKELAAKKDSIKIAYTIANNNAIKIKGLNDNDNLIEVCERPTNIVYLASKQKIYTQSVSDSKISVVDINSLSKIKDITFDGKYQIKKIVKSESEDKLYAYAIEVNKIFIIDTSTDSIISSIDTKPLTSDFIFEGQSDKIYVLSNNFIDTFSSSGSLINSYKFNTPDFFSSVSYKNNKVFVINSNRGYFIAVDLILNSESKIELKYMPRKILTDQNNIYLLSNNSVDIYSLNNLDNKKSILTKNSDNDNFYFSRSKNYIYISSKNSSNLSIIDINSQSLSEKVVSADSNIRDLVEL